MRYALTWGSLFQERPYEKDFDSLEAALNFLDEKVDRDVYGYRIDEIQEPWRREVDMALERVALPEEDDMWITSEEAVEMIREVWPTNNTSPKLKGGR